MLLTTTCLLLAALGSSPMDRPVSKSLDGPSAAGCATDADADGFCAESDDCDDANSSVHPGADQICDGVNNDCSDPGWPEPPVDEQDRDGDGFAPCESDCVDFPGYGAFANPAATEVCDAQDNDCDGLRDEGFPERGQLCVTQVGACTLQGVTSCGGTELESGCYYDGIPHPRTLLHTDTYSFPGFFMSLDRFDNVYVQRAPENTVDRITPSGVVTRILDQTGDGTMPFIVSTFAWNDVTVDTSARAYIASQDHVFRIEVDGTVGIVLGPSGDGSHPLAGPIQVAADDAGNVYAAAHGSWNVFRVSSDGDVQQVLAFDGESPPFFSQMIVDAANNVYVGAFARSEVWKIPAQGPPTRILGSGGDGVHIFAHGFGAADLVLDRAGNLYAYGRNSANVFQVAPDGTVQQVLQESDFPQTGGISHFSGMVVDAFDNLWVVATGETVSGDGLDLGFSVSYPQVVKRSPDGTVRSVMDYGADGTTILLDALRPLADPFGNVYINQFTGAQTFKITPEGPILRIFDDRGDGTTFVGEYWNAATDSRGNLYIISSFTQSNDFYRLWQIPLADICDGFDNDCDGVVDEGVTEQCDNGVDDDCNGLVDDQDERCRPLLVTVDSFTASATAAGVLLRWETVVEIDNVGFRILAAPRGGDPLPVHDGLIPAAGNELGGASYRHLDTTHKAGSPIHYWLEDVDAFGRTTRHGPITPSRGRKRSANRR